METVEQLTQELYGSQLDIQLLGYLGTSQEEILSEIKRTKAIADLIVNIEKKATYAPDARPVEEEICRTWGIPLEDMFAKTRKREYTNARKTLVVICRTVPQLKGFGETSTHYVNRTVLSALGYYMTHNGHIFDHASVLHMYRRD